MCLLRIEHNFINIIYENWYIEPNFIKLISIFEKYNISIDPFLM